MQRTLVLNAIAGAAKAEVPANGIETPRVTIEDLEAHSEETPNAAWLGTAPAAPAGAAPAANPAAQSPTRALIVTRLDEWHKAFPPRK